MKTEYDLYRTLQEIGEILEVPGGHQHYNLPNVLRERLKAQNMIDDQAETPEESAKPCFDTSLVSEQWLGDVVDFLHLVAGDLSHDNRLVALAARQLIQNGPRVE